jgi:AcrR family transcriptional regulator
MVTSTEPAKTRRTKASETEAALKAAAVKVFDERGYLSTKIVDITAAAGRSAGSFYNYFAGKEQLLEALLADSLSLGDEIAAEHPEDHDLSDPEQMRWHVAAFWRTFVENRAVMIALQQASMVDEHFATRLTELLTPDREVLAQHMRYVQDQGVELPGDPEIVASAMSSLLWQFAFTWRVGPPPPGRMISDDEAIDTLTALLLNGIAGLPRTK